MGRATVVAGCAIVAAMTNSKPTPTSWQVEPLSAWEQQIAEVAGRAAGRAVAPQLEQLARAQTVTSRTAEVTARARPSSRQAWPTAVHARAVEHIVTEAGAATAATPNAPFAVSAGWVLELATEWTTAAMPIVAATAIAELGDATNGVPAVPVVTLAPVAGPQNGEKRDAHSRAFKVEAAPSPSVIDSTLYLNWSQQLEELAPVAAELGRAMQQAAVADEADRQVGEVIVADATAAADLAAALAVFDAGRYLPTVLLVPPGQLAATLGTYSPADLAALGVRVQLAHVSKAVLLAPGAVLGWLLPLQLMAAQPAVLGTGRAYAMFGQVAVDATGAAVVG